ncbi:MAG: DNA-processing protein DprA [Pseudomonadota bacterium]
MTETVLELTDQQRFDWLRLRLTRGIGPISFRAVLNRYGSAAAGLDAIERGDLSGTRKGGALQAAREADTQAVWSATDAAGLRLVAPREAGYPRLLRQIPAAPPLLWIKSSLPLADLTPAHNPPHIAIVGARNCSAIGSKYASDLANELGQAGAIIVSGMARGIDGAAHHASINTGTIAVLAGGADVVFPPEHAKLHAAISERGVVISEQPPGAAPQARHFPKRNRIVSGISHAVLVIEAAARSGTLITARFALEQGREVFAVPGHPSDPRTGGTNRLLQDGAHLLTDTQDVLRVLAPIMAGPRQASWLDDTQAGGAPPFGRANANQQTGEQAQFAETPTDGLEDYQADLSTGFKDVHAERELTADGHTWVAGARLTNADIAPIEAHPPIDPSGSDITGTVTLAPDVAEPFSAVDHVEAALAAAPISADELARHCCLPIAAVHAAMAQLELAGRAVRTDAGLFCLPASGGPADGK